MNDFLSKKCVPCEGGTEPLAESRVQEYLAVVPGWSATAGHKKIERELVFKDFLSAITFVNNLAALAESEGHHPNISLYSWNHLRIELYTHAIGGLSDNDFIMAAKTNQLLSAHPELLV